MASINQKFANNRDKEFYQVLRDRVSEYFKSEKISRHANGNMVIKTIFMFSLLFTPYMFIVAGGIESVWLTMLLWAITGLGMAGVGFNVMHDANHKSYSSKPWVNKWLGYSMNLLGGNAEMWKYQHNVLHHTYTNVESADQDINGPFFIRLSPHSKRYWIHRYQVLYAWFFYGLSTFAWVTYKDFVQIFNYRNLGLIRNAKGMRKEMAQLIAWKLIYYAYILVLPLIFSPLAWGWTILGFAIMHFTTGLAMTLVFQTAHVMPECEYPLPDDGGQHEHSWVVHELLTTTNFGPKSKVFSWFIGGLNYQVEHHLFPKICHVHYPKLSRIVAQTAREFNVPYNSQKTFIGAVVQHFKMLYQLGHMEAVPVQSAR